MDEKKELEPRERAKAQSFLRLERNLNTIGFFSASKPGEKRSTQSRTIETKRQIDGKTYVSKTTIFPNQEYGLPNTSDQDKYFALMHLVNRIKLRDGVVKNPIGFSTMELIEILGISVAGSAYEEIRGWLKRLVLTGIVSEGAIYLPHRKKYASDTFHAFSRVITAGEELADGAIADRHYVFLGDWLLESFNRNYVLPIEMEGYRKLHSPLAKTLVPHLQLWLYGSRIQRRFEKRYSDLCAICGIEICKYLSEIHRQLRTAMGELQVGGYIASWKVVDTADGKDFKVVINHGEKFFIDQALLSGKEEPAKPVFEELPPVFQAMVERGVTPSAARKLVRSLPDDQIKIAMDQLEYCDQVVQGSHGKIKNPPGFYVTFLRNNDPVPHDFVSSSKAAFMRMEEEARGKEMAKQWLIQQEYDDYVRTEVERMVALLPEREREEHLDINRRDVRKAYPFMTAKGIQEAADLRLRRNLRESSPLLTLDEFTHNRSPQLGFSF